MQTLIKSFPICMLIPVILCHLCLIKPRQRGAMDINHVSSSLICYTLITLPMQNLYHVDIFYCYNDFKMTYVMSEQQL